MQEIMVRISKQRNMELWKRIAEQMEQNYGFADAWNNAFDITVKEIPMFAALQKEEITVMNALAAELGKSDMSTQLKHLQLTEAMLNELYLKAGHQQNEKARIYRTLGISAGIVSALIIW